MKSINLKITKIKCLRTSIEFGADEIYCGGIFIPVKLQNEELIKGKAISFATNDISMRKGKELNPNSEFSFDIPTEYDDYILILQLIEKDDGLLLQKFKSGKIAEEIENVDILKNAFVKLIGSINIKEINQGDIWASLGKMVVKALPAVVISLIGDIIKQIKMDDIISSKQFSKEKAKELNLNSPKEFLFSKLFAKYKLSISIN